MRFRLHRDIRGTATALGLCISTLGLSALPANAQGYMKVKLVSDIPGAKNTDPNLVNPWGLSSLSGSPWWASDNGSGLTTLYDGQGNIQTLVVTIPPSHSDPNQKGTPTGTVANSSTDFGSAPFIFDSEDGTISAWFGASSTVTQIDKGTHAVYKGLAIGKMNQVNVLYATNFRSGHVETYDMDFNPFSLGASAFKDPNLPVGFAPFGIQEVNGNIWVTFAKQDAAKHDPVKGAGLGFVDEFDSSGKLLKRLVHGNYMNAPWGIALAPATFGTFSNDLLVGNFGSGEIAAFNPANGAFKGLVKLTNGQPIVTSGLWALQFGQGGMSGPTNWLYFSAGIQGEKHGLFGYIISVL